MDKIRVVTIDPKYRLVILNLKIENRNNQFGVRYQGDFYKLELRKVLTWKGKPILILVPYLTDIVTTLTYEEANDKIRTTFWGIKEKETT